MGSTLLLEQVRRTIVEHRLLAPRDRVVVAVSGGPDSVVLLHVLAALQGAMRWTLHIAHLDHGLRETSARDAAFVQELGSRWRIPTTIERRDVGAIAQHEGWSLEDGARRVRYQFLLEVARRQSAHRLAVAHTADDQAETVLMRLVRGTGLLGLGAIPLARLLDDGVWIVRPLLEVWRRDVLAYLREADLAFCEDHTNHDCRFVRNRIRLELLPLLEHAYNPNIKHTLTQLAEQSRWDYAYLQAAAGRQWKRLAKVTPPARPAGGHPAPWRGGGLTSDRVGGVSPHVGRGSQGASGMPVGLHVTISVPSFLRQPKALQRQLIRQAIHRVRGDLLQVEFRHWLEVERLFHDRPRGTVLDLPGGVRFRREDERVICERAAVSHQSPPLEERAS